MVIESDHRLRTNHMVDRYLCIHVSALNLRFNPLSLLPTSESLFRLAFGKMEERKDTHGEVGLSQDYDASVEQLHAT